MDPDEEVASKKSRRRVPGPLRQQIRGLTASPRHAMKSAAACMPEHIRQTAEDEKRSLVRGRQKAIRDPSSFPRRPLYEQGVRSLAGVLHPPPPRLHPLRPPRRPALCALRRRTPLRRHNSLSGRGSLHPFDAETPAERFVLAVHPNLRNDDDDELPLAVALSTILSA